MTSTILEMRDITKTFPGVKALSNVNLSVDEGEIHAIVGENGAGKSTLMKVLSGVYPDGDYEGTDHLPRARNATSKASTTASTSTSSSSTRSWRWCRCSRSPRTSSSATSTPNTASSTGTPTRRALATLLKKVGLNEDPQDPHHQYRRRQAAAGRDRQGAEQGSRAADPRRADGDRSRKKTASALLDLLIEFKRQGITSILISHKLNEVAPRRRPRDDHPRRPDDRDAGARRDQRRPHHHLDGRPPARRPLPAARAQDRRRHLRGEELVRLPPDPCRPAGHQGHRHQGAARARSSASPG